MKYVKNIFLVLLLKILSERVANQVIQNYFTTRIVFRCIKVAHCKKQMNEVVQELVD